jgi:hypothetical protein
MGGIPLSLKMEYIRSSVADSNEPLKRNYREITGWSLRRLFFHPVSIPSFVETGKTRVIKTGAYIMLYININGFSGKAMSNFRDESKNALGGSKYPEAFPRNRRIPTNHVLPPPGHLIRKKSA